MNKSNLIGTPTIKWMRNKVKPEIISSSLTSLLLEKEKSRPLLLQIIDNTNLQKSFKKEKAFDYKTDLKISPKLFFNATVLKKINQIRDIFIDFDEDRSRTLEISELHKMFNSNKIPLTEEELAELFGKGRKRKIADYKLSFFDIVVFSLSEEENWRFRNLMKKVREKVGRDVYIPLDFNSALEYIYNKGQIMKGFQKINRGIRTLDRLERQFTLQTEEKVSTNIILNKFGIGRNINMKQVCKGFHDVIDISHSFMRRFPLKEPSRTINVTERASNCRTTIKEEQGTSAGGEERTLFPSKNSRNSMRKILEFPIIELNSDRKLMPKEKKIFDSQNRQYVVQAKVCSNERSPILFNNSTSVYSTHCKTDRNQ